MPVPMPPKTKLFTTQQKHEMRPDSRMMSAQIKQMTAELATQLDIPVVLVDPKVLVEEKVTQQYSDQLAKPTPKTLPFIPQEHLTQYPFRENAALRKLGYNLKKETDKKKPVKRSPKRTPTNKTTGEK